MLYQFEILFLTDVAITPTQKKVQYIHHHLTHINTADQKVCRTSSGWLLQVHPTHNISVL